MNAPPEENPRAVIVVSSHVARGSVGNRAVVLALESLGIPVWAVPTVILPWHPGHGRATRIVPDPREFAALMKDLENAPWLGEVAGVLSGYLGDATQAEAVASLVGAVKARNPRAIYLCDPVMGDMRGLYVPQPVAEAMRDVLMPIADIATPNRYELEWMMGERLDELRNVMSAALTAGPPTMLVTSSPALMAGGIGNLLLTPSEALLAEHRMIDKPPNGLGDLTSALLLARFLEGQPAGKALQSATASVFEILARTAKRGGDELQIETDAQSLSHPMAMVHLRHLMHPGPDRRA
ncbi:pyridoxal kinase PdxY [Pseudaminobacter sp. 19-2017]|uniref:pyridoxal kinase n=1 Tax=Pseudaminobacter soli (ex Zhang et al. 2022) TaxID=2831468 RepID=A0A942I1Z7_9HYPH|nr:pyridoxal kinase PdxY [Pseudaminobacter soli]MBS3647913.1 pyridoxal kinase PdxY [Pseudaminobacter soli]